MLVHKQLIDLFFSTLKARRERLQTFHGQHPLSVIGEVAHVIKLIEELFDVSATLAFVAQDGWLKGGLDPDRA